MDRLPTFNSMELEIWEAYAFLDGNREIGMGYSPIKLIDLNEYWDTFGGFSIYFDRHEFIELIILVDKKAVELKAKDEAAKARAKKKPK